MEMIHRYEDSYPFGLQKDNEFTYLQVLRENLTEQQIHWYKLKNKIFREMGGQHLVRLVKLLRENNDLQFLFEYFPCSIRQYLQWLHGVCEGQLQEKAYRDLVNSFLLNVNGIVQMLVHYQIKTDLLLTNLVVSQKSESFHLKVFVEPDAQCYALQLHFSERSHEDLKLIIQENKEILIEFYGNERKKVVIEFQQLLEQVFGKKEGSEQLHPNFVINGSKLVFNQGEPKLDHQNKGSISANKIECLGISLQESKQLQAIHKKREIKERNSMKIKEIKEKLNKLEQHKLQSGENIHKKDNGGLVETVQVIYDKTGENLGEQQLNLINQSKQLKKERNKSREIRSGSPRQKDIIQNGKKASFLKQQAMKISETFPNREQNTQKYKMKIRTTQDIEVQEAKDTNKVSKDVICQMTSNNQQEKPSDTQKDPIQSKYGTLLDVFQKREMHSRNSDQNGRNNGEQDINKNRKGSASVISTYEKEVNFEEKHVSHQHNDIKRLENQGDVSSFVDKVKLAKSKAEKALNEHRKARRQ